MHLLTRVRFPLLFGLLVAAIDVALILIIWTSAPHGMRWLGDTIQNSSDIAVYFSYLAQGADGALLLANRFAVEPHAHRFDLFWSSAGFLARSGLPFIILHELLRICSTLALAVAVYAAALQLTRDEKNSKLATILSFGGVGFGWMYSIWLNAADLWTARTYAAPDVVTEFSVAPILLGGAHMILSLALLITGLRLTWHAWETRRLRTALTAALTVAVLTAFHPYFGIMFAIFSALCVLRNRRNISLQVFVYGVALSLLTALPSIIIYLPLSTDRVFSEHHLIANILPLPPILSWLCTLLPFIAALAWRWRRGAVLRQQEEWLITWILSAIICMTLPLPWTRKYLEGLGVALALLTLPAWLAVRDWIVNQRPAWLARIISILLLLASCLTPLHLFTSQLAWISPDPERTKWFYASEETFAAWEWLRMHTEENSVVLSDDKWLNIWTPAYANRTVWIGHDHETPDFWTKRALWDELFSTTNKMRARRILGATNINYVLLTSTSTHARFPSWLDPQWKTVYQTPGVVILERRDIPDTVANIGD